MEKLLKQFPSLITYFKNEEWRYDWFERLNIGFTNQLLKRVLLLNLDAISIFLNFNRLLQREEPAIHIRKSSTENFDKKISNRIVKAAAKRDVSILRLNLDHFY